MCVWTKCFYSKKQKGADKILVTEVKIRVRFKRSTTFINYNVLMEDPHKNKKEKKKKKKCVRAHGRPFSGGS